MPNDSAVDVASRMVAAIEAVQARDAREYADARLRWRQHVNTAAEQAGRLPQSSVDDVLRDAKLLGFSPDDFAADVHAVMEDAQLASEIEAAQAAMTKNATAVESARLEVEQLQADYLRERGERDVALNAIEATLREKRRNLERKEGDVTRCGSSVQRAYDQQMKFRTARARQRIFG